MNIRDAKTEVIHTIRAYTVKNEWGSYAIPPLRQRPLLLIGPPGIGKTAIMEQAAAECGIGFVSYTMTHHTRQSAIGLPFIERKNFDGREYAFTEYTMSEIIASVFHCMEESGCREGLLFLDEINCVSETLAPAMLQFLQNKTFGTHRLPEGWILAAAGNPAEYNKSVRDFDIATLDRLKYIEVEADYEAWRSYALEHNLHGAVLSYLDTHQDRFYVLKQTYTETEFATARGWEDLSCLLLQYEHLSLPVTADLIEQYLHSKELACDFAGYYQLFSARKKALPISELLQSEKNAFDLCKNFLSEASFDEKLNLAYLLLSALCNELNNWSLRTRQAAALQSMEEKLQRFVNQQPEKHLTPPLLQEFLKKEQDILRIRKEHGLSSDRELEEMQYTLYEMRTRAYQYLEQGTTHPAVSGADTASGSHSVVSGSDTASGSHSAVSGSDTASGSHSTISGSASDLHSASQQLQSHLERALLLLSADDGAAFSLFLSLLQQNKTLQEFLKKHPCRLWEEKTKRLSFQTREEALRKKLLDAD